MLKRINFLTAGESHGKGLLGIIDGLPSNLEISSAYINSQLSRRQKGHGRSARMKIEHDQAEIYCGVRNQKTSGAPIGLIIENLDYKNWKNIMTPNKIESSNKKTLLVSIFLMGILLIMVKESFGFNKKSLEFFIAILLCFSFL